MLEARDERLCCFKNNNNAMSVGFMQNKTNNVNRESTIGLVLCRGGLWHLMANST